MSSIRMQKRPATSPMMFMTSDSPGRSRLDRASLQRIAAAGGGQYFELDRDPDRDIANAIIDAGRRQVPVTTEEGTAAELYWRFLAAGLALGFPAVDLARGLGEYSGARRRMESLGEAAGVGADRDGAQAEAPHGIEIVVPGRWNRRWQAIIIERLRGAGYRLDA